VRQLVIGDFSVEQMKAFMARLLAYLEELKKMLAKIGDAEYDPGQGDMALLEALIAFADAYRQGEYDYAPL